MKFEKLPPKKAKIAVRYEFSSVKAELVKFFRKRQADFAYTAETDRKRCKGT